MLILTQEAQSRTVITVPPSDKEQVIEVVTVRIGPRSARLGFAADRSVRIVRDDAVAKREKESA